MCNMLFHHFLYQLCVDVWMENLHSYSLFLVFCFFVRCNMFRPSVL